jgi:hypothetical protein
MSHFESIWEKTGRCVLINEQRFGALRTQLVLFESNKQVRMCSVAHKRQLDMFATIDSKSNVFNRHRLPSVCQMHKQSVHLLSKLCANEQWIVRDCLQPDRGGNWRCMFGSELLRIECHVQCYIE